MLPCNLPRIMGILNVTPDSFSDGGDFFYAKASIGVAVERAFLMVEEGASIIDIGGESSRPGAQEVSLDEELKRTIPIIQALKKQGIQAQLSIDTCKPEVMQQAMAAGADIINDINALRAQGALTVAKETRATVSLMHRQGQPRTMQRQPHYENVVDEVKEFLQQRVNACLEAGIDKKKLIIDPGFGFGKTLPHNIELFKCLDIFQAFKLPVLVGISRKSMIGALLDGAAVNERLYGGLALALLAVQKGAAILRVHDVKATADVLKIYHAISL